PRSSQNPRRRAPPCRSVLAAPWATCYQRVDRRIEPEWSPSTMSHVSRREFLAASALAAGALVRADEPREAAKPRAIGANDSIVLGCIGVGGMGTGLLDRFQGFPDVRVAAVCDVYEPNRLRAREKAGGSPEAVADFRRLLDRKDIDAVVI